MLLIVDLWPKLVEASDNKISTQTLGSGGVPCVRLLEYFSFCFEAVLSFQSPSQVPGLYGQRRRLGYNDDCRF
jgi:hypothetical protein